MSNEISGLEEDLKGFLIQLESVQSGLESDPNNEDFLALKAEIEEAVSATETLIQELKPTSSIVENIPSSKETQSTFINTNDHEVETFTYQVNDTVLAKWVSGDNSFYPARITSITGSASNPIYYVTFKSYGNTETLRKTDLKPINSNNESKKRKADNMPSNSTSSTSTFTSTSISNSASTSMSSPTLNSNSPSVSVTSPTTSSVITASASINPDLAKSVKDETNNTNNTNNDSQNPNKKPKKIKANKELEAGKSKWQDFAAKGKFNKGNKKKESMFRTGDSVTARVGFIGSGQSMRKDPTKTRHVYQVDEDDNNY